VQFLKNPDHLHWGFEGHWLGSDEWGEWIGVPLGSLRWKAEELYPPTPSNAVFCAPHGEWWHLHYNGSEATNYTHFVDIVTPPLWVSENRYEMIDLDLDVAVHIDGTVEVQDEDEFEVHQVRYGYSQDMISRASAETERVVDAINAGAEPFFVVAQRWLGALVSG
jgi:hypothetical protein